MLPLASFLALQEIPRRPFGPTYAEQTYLAQGRGLLLASSWYRTLVGGGNQTIYSCGIADFVLKQQSLHLGWHFAGVALWCHRLLPLGCCQLKHTKMDRSSLEARKRLQGKGWLCLVLLWSAVTSSHDAAELCREKWSRQDEPDVFAAEDGVLCKSTPVLPAPCLAACPACIEAWAHPEELRMHLCVVTCVCKPGRPREMLYFLCEQPHQKQVVS